MAHGLRIQLHGVGLVCVLRMAAVNLVGKEFRKEGTNQCGYISLGCLANRIGQAREDLGRSNIAAWNPE